MKEDPAVLILQGKYPEVRGSIIIKLLKLYKKHEILSVKIIGLLNLISNSIDSGDGEKIEIYTEIEKEYIRKLENLNLIIKSFEELYPLVSVELNKQKSILLSSHKSIQDLDILIRDKLQNYLIILSVQINKFSIKPFHTLPSNIIPQFVDLSI